MGARTGSVASGTTTTAVLNGVINTTGDDTTFQTDRVMFLDAAAEADREKVITTWTDLTGTATFAARGSGTYTSENYIISKRGDYTLAEYRTAVSTALRKTKRTYRQIIPLTPTRSLYPLDMMTWLEGDGDIDAVWVSYSPNMLHNENFDYWPSVNPGTAVPDGWTLVGSGAVLTRIAATSGLSPLRSAYAVQITRSGADADLQQAIPQSLTEYITRATNAALPTLQAGAWVSSGIANIARIGISNGTSTTWSSYYTRTDNVPMWLTISYTPTATDKQLQMILMVDTTNGAATFHSAILVVAGSVPVQLRDQGSQSYFETEVNHVVRNVGGWPLVDLGVAPGMYGQLVVYGRRPFIDMTADADVIDDQYGRCLEAGLVVFLLENIKPSQDRARFDRVLYGDKRMGIEGELDIWKKLSNNLIDLPVPKFPRQAVVSGA